MSESQIDPQGEAPNEPTAPAAEKHLPFPGIGGSVLLLIILIVANILSVIVALPFLGLDGLMNTADEGMPIWLVVFSYFFSFGGTVFIGYKITKERFNDVFLFKPFSYLILIPLVLAMPGLWVLVFQGMAGITSFMPISEQFIEMMQQLFEENMLAALFVGVFGAAFLEEMLFRGIMLRGMLRRMSPTAAIIISSIFFGVAHMNPWQFFSAFIIGSLAGWIYYRSRSIWPCIILHGANNLLVGFFGEQIFSMLGYPADVLESTVVPFMPIWVVAIGAAVFAAGIYGLNQVLHPPISYHDAEEDEVTQAEF